jgi:AAA15 family ATPase/GTPase
MDNVVLKSLSVENFASFAEQISFTTEADSGKKEFMENTFVYEDTRFNKVSFIYGANGSGKTFFCKIIMEIQRLLNWSPLTAMNNLMLLSIEPFKGIDAPVQSFAFDMGYREKPTRFTLSILLNGITYYYEFAMKGKQVVYELLTKKRRRTEKLLERLSPSYKDIALHSELKDFESMKQVVKEEALCLPLAALLNNRLATEIVEAIKSIQIVNMAGARLGPAQQQSFSSERLEKYINIVKKADPTIRSIRVSFEEEEIPLPKVEENDFENRAIIAKQTKVGISTEHAVYQNGMEMNSTPISFFIDESLGTVKLFTALPYLFDVLENGGVLIIDELENGLHLSLAKEIIELFSNNESNPNGAQLVCTSHQPLLVSGDFRRDQVWVTCKDTFGKSTLHRMSDLKTSRANVNLSNRILEGAFGCNPKSFFNKITHVI